MIDDGAFGCVFALFFLYGTSIGPFCYLVSFIFNFEGNAMLSCFFLNIVLGTIIPLITYILRLIKSTRSTARVLQWVFRAFPAFSFGYGLLNVTSISVLKGIEDTDDIADIKLAGGDIMMLIIMGIVDWILVFTFEYMFTTKKMGTFVPKSLEPQKPIQDSDVLDEIALLNKISP
jgi:ATP-binding cassette, subfamily A (ABC1), member 3